MSSKRTRNFATVVYPESAPDDWFDILVDIKVPAFVSPLHDKDVNPDGEIKKAHYHVMLMFEGVKTEEQARVIFDSIGGVGLETIQSIRGYARYLCHLDNPEKYQYLQEEVRGLCGADYPSVIGLALDKYKAIGEMMEYCNSNTVVSYSALLEYARDNRFDWFRILCDCGTMVMKEYLKSYKWSSEQELYHKEF